MKEVNACLLAISEGTLTADLNQLETWFTKYQLKLVRRPGLGVFIEGTEIARRQALTSFICKQVNEHHSIVRKLYTKLFLTAAKNVINLGHYFAINFIDKISV